MDDGIDDVNPPIDNIITVHEPQQHSQLSEIEILFCWLPTGIIIRNNNL